MRVTILTLIFINLGCVTKPPRLNPCTILNKTTAQCQKQGSRQKTKDKPIDNMIGYTCYSPKDRGETKKYIKKLILLIESDL